MPPAVQQQELAPKTRSHGGQFAPAAANGAEEPGEEQTPRVFPTARVHCSSPCGCILATASPRPATHTP